MKLNNKKKYCPKSLVVITQAAKPKQLSRIRTANSVLLYNDFACKESD
jgi:hypothetical protein